MDRGFFLLGLGDGLLAGEEDQLVDMSGDLVDGEGDGPGLRSVTVAELGDPEVLEVGDDGVARPLVLADRTSGEVVAGLLFGSVEVTTEGLGLADDDAGPEQVDIAGAPRGCAGGVALEELDAFGDHPEAAQQVRPELLGVGLLGVLGPGGPPVVDDGAPVGGEAVEVATDRAAVELGGSRGGGGHGVSLRRGPEQICQTPCFLSNICCQTCAEPRGASGPCATSYRTRRGG